MKKLQISGKEFIRQDGLYYNLTDLFRLTTLNGIRLEPWGWAQSENRSRDISRRGWFFKKCWAKEQTLIEYAKYLTPGLYTDVIRAVDRDSVDRLISLFGESRAARLDYRVAQFITEREAEREQRTRLLNEQARVIKADRVVEPLPDISNTPRFNADDLPKPSRAAKMKATMDRARPQPATRSMQHSRSMGPSVTHHRSEPDYLTQALVTQSVLNNWDDSSHRHSSHSRSDDTCHTSSHSSHSSHDSHSSWSGDSGGSYDSGGGGCGD